MARGPAGTQLTVAPGKSLAKAGSPAKAAGSAKDAAGRLMPAVGGSTPESRAAARKAAARAVGKSAAGLERRPGRSLGWVQGSLCGAGAALSLPTALLVTVLLAPGVLALLIDDRPSKPVARTMLLFGMAASTGAVVDLWRVGHSMTDALAIIMHLQTVLIAWMAGAFGWLLTEIVPLVVGLGMAFRNTDERKRLTAARATLVAEWGLVEPSTDEAAEDALD